MSKKINFSIDLFDLCLYCLLVSVLYQISAGVSSRVLPAIPEAPLGVPSPIKSSNFDYKALSKPFIEVSKRVTPTVVAISVTITHEAEICRRRRQR